jgi:hypothetical protein
LRLSGAGPLSWQRKVCTWRILNCDLTSNISAYECGPDMRFGDVLRQMMRQKKAPPERG